MNLALCMAGLYRRFRDAGYAGPKFLLDWNGRTVLDEILATMTAGGAFRRVLLVANERDVAYTAQLQTAAAAAGVEAADVAFVADTRGQAETARIAAVRLRERFAAGGEPVVFHNIDTVLVGRDYPAMAAALADWDGYIDVFPSDSPNYSYVRLDAAGAVVEMAEKVVISPYATSGLYGFRSADQYVKLADTAAYRGEFYVSDVYQRLLAAGGRVTANRDSAGHRTVVLGTPAEYEAARRGEPAGVPA